MSDYNYNPHHLPCLDWVVWPGMDVIEDCNDSGTLSLAYASMNLDSNTACLLRESNFHLFYDSKYGLNILQLPVFMNT